MINIQPADRIGAIKEYYFSAKLKEISQLRMEGKDIINLGIGSPDLMPSEEVIQTLQNSAAIPSNHGYQSYIGILPLRQGFASFYKNNYGVELCPDTEILPLMGSKEGIMHISMAFLNPGDEVLVPNPGYPTYRAAANLMQAKVRRYDLTEANAWQPDLQALEKEDLSKVKLMWLNYPNMPTGTKADREVMEAIVAFGKRHSIVICNDNPYSFILNDKPFSILEIKGARDIAIELNSLSKSHNMAGWRIGMAASNPKFISYILRVKSNMDSGMFRPMQEAAVEALKAGASWFNRVNKEYAMRRELVFELLDALGCSYNRSQVGLFVWAKVPIDMGDGEYLSDYALKNAHLFITPGFIFGSNGIQYVRISLCADLKLLQESINRVKQIEILEICQH